MYTKNYYEMKAAITDGLNEFCENLPKNEKKEMTEKNEQKEKISYLKIFKLLISIFPIIPVVFTILFKFISMSSVWYYQFDFDYYDFSISKADMFIFLYTIISALSGIVIAILISYFLKLLLKKLNMKNFWLELLANIFISVIINIGVSLFINYLFMFKIMWEYYWIVSFFSYGITFMFLPNNKTIKKSFMIFVIVTIILISFFSGTLFKLGYETSQEKREFQIINYTIEDVQEERDNQEKDIEDKIDDDLKEDNPDIVFENKELYVVISESEDNFSAYKCDINENELIVYTNYHKYFDVSTDYEVYSFDNIEYFTYKFKYNGENYECITEPDSIELEDE